MPEKDKVNIGLTSEARQVYNRLLEEGLFAEGRDIARFALAWAIREGMKAAPIESTETVWNIQTFDPDGEIRELVCILLPQTEFPYRTSESLYNQGLLAMAEHVESRGELSISEVFEEMR